ncbi:aldolase [Agrocybe pediades]|nr:aldolase [Agrocybe pediades]
MNSARLLRRVLPRISSASGRLYSTQTGKSARNAVNIVEVGPRDGLQNEKGATIPVDLKVDLINRLARAGVLNVEAGSFVSPKWVPQMAGTAEVLKRMEKLVGVHYPVLVPNQRGLEDLLKLLAEEASSPPLTDEVAIFTAATDAFTKANLNCTIAESLTRLEPVAQTAVDHGLRVRGYVSVVIACPFSGKTDYKRVREVAKAMLDMGCYEVSLGETVGQGRPHEVADMIEEVKKSIPVEKLAGHFHDTYGTGVANVMTALQHGIRTIDSSVGGLGGCPYSPGATGNVATEDVLYALQGSPYQVVGSTYGGGTIDLDKISDIGWWISEALGRDNASRVGRALRARRQREEKEKMKSKL